MTSSVLFRRREFGTGPPVFREMQIRVVAKSILAPRFKRDDACEGPSSLREHLALGRRKTHGADEPSGPLGLRDGTQRLDEFSIVRRISLLTRSIDPRPTGASNSRLTVKRINLKTRVIGEGVPASVAGVGDGLDSSIGFERRGILDGLLRDGGEIPKSEDLDSQRLKNRADLIQFVRIATGQKDFFHGLIPEKWSEANRRVVVSYDSCGLGSRESEQKEHLDLVIRRNAAIFYKSESPP